MRCQRQFAGEGKKQYTQGDTGGQHRGDDRREREGAAAQSSLGHAVNAQPGQSAFGEPTAQAPQDHGEYHEYAGQEALARLPDRMQRVARLLYEFDQPLPVVGRWIE